MSTDAFTHLHCHSHYSLLDGAGTIARLLDRAGELGMTALALTDHGNLHGAVEFYRAAKERGINPIIGYEAYIAPQSRLQKDASGMKDASFHLTLLARNQTGVRNLLKLASAAFTEGFYFRPRIDKEILEAHNEGLICLSGCVSSEINRILIDGQPSAVKRAEEVAAWFHRVFGERYFIEIQNNGLEVQQIALQGACELADRMGIPLVATSDVHYVRQSDAGAQDILLCVNTGKFRTDQKRMRMESDQFHLRSPQEMYDAFPGRADAVRRSQEIADSVDIELELGQRHFPVFTPPEQKTSEQYLRQLCIKGLKERYANDAERCPGGELSEEVMARLDRELGVIEKLGFPNYFLIVWDFVNFAREQGIPATARGSGVGSLVSYSLYLSHVCPLKYDLLFERFLDESRREAPDIDIDFCQQRRAEVIQYVKDRYGVENVAQIGTFGTLQAKAAIRDVGRAMGMPISRVDSVVALVPPVLNIKLEKALETSDQLREACDKDPQVRDLIGFARQVEGLARNIGTHAAAVVIADRPLTDYVPLQRITGKEEIITQWSMNDVERAGLLKMDFLGLRNLTILAKAVELVEQMTGQRIDPYGFPLEDQATFDIFCRGETKGVFQFESGGIRELLQRMKPDHFRDIIATNALYRPGPLEGGMVDDYIQVKHGRRKPEYKHPVMKEVLEETHGVMVYQEQVMRILNRLGGIRLADAYSCIKAISKKKLELIAKFRQEFIAGAGEKGLAKNEADDLFGLIEKFAGYGFNKCVAGDTVILDATTGDRTTVERLFHDRGPFNIHALGEDGRLRVRKVTDVVWNGRKPVYEVTTAQGKRLVATGNHPLRTLKGWRLLSELQPGDAVASPRRLSVANGHRWPRHQVLLLAHLLAEGNTCHPTCLYFYNNDRRLIDEFVEAAELFPESVARVTGRRGRFEVCIGRGEETRFPAGHTPWNAGGAAVAVKAPPKRSGAFRWTEQLGLIGCKAGRKFVPPEAFRLADDQIELLLGRLWAGDGFVGAAGQMPYYATASAQLARDVQTLLLRIGIVAGIHAKTMRYVYNGQPREARGYTVHLVGEDSINAFLDRVAGHVLGREQQVEAYRQYVAQCGTARSSKDTIPAEVSRWVDDDRRSAGLGWRDLEARSGVSVRELVRKNPSAKRGFRRETIARLARFFGSQRLQQVAESDVFWDRIVSIEPAGVTDTYDLTVEGDHNFVADGLIVHNSHSTAYALIAYMTAYLKAHYPVAFMAALLSSDIPGRNFKRKDSVVEHLDDCKRMGITVLPPDVNRSEAEFAVDGQNICFALSAIKGCGAGAARAIADERRRGGPYHSLFDFCERLDPGTVGRAAIETLVKAGAFDSLGGNRAQQFAAIDRALQSGASAAADRRSGQLGLFGDDDASEESGAASLPELPEWDDRQRLAHEKEVLGFYLSQHPLQEYEETFATYRSHRTSELGKLAPRAEVFLGGMLAALKYSHTKNPQPGKPSRYVMFDLEDTDGLVRCILWPDKFVEYGEMVEADAILMVRGKVDKRPDSEEATLIVDELIPLDQLAARYTRGVAIRLYEEQHGERVVEQLHEILCGYPGTRELNLVIYLRDGSRVPCSCRDVRVEINAEMRRRVEELLGPGNFRLIASPPRPAPAHAGAKRGGSNWGGNGRRRKAK
ncbi:MAG: DNA polymerase III subunit alpha [Thermoguttaceae bacterium]|jgi:DNA polymerase-3 subunit alpha|nr:DNA polymerase III subunit alpha [Thermoguttaceae bacterium]